MVGVSDTELWLVSDYEPVTLGDGGDPRLVAVTSTPQLAHRVAALLNGRKHPNRSLGYAYDFRVDTVPCGRLLDDMGWTDEDILAVVDRNES